MAKPDQQAPLNQAISLGLFSSEAWQFHLAVCDPLSRRSGCCHDMTASVASPMSELCWPLKNNPSYASFFLVSSPLSDVGKFASPGHASQGPSEITLCFVMIALWPWQSSVLYGLFIRAEAVRLQSCGQIKYQDFFLFWSMSKLRGTIGISHNWQWDCKEEQSRDRHTEAFHFIRL